MKTLMLPFAARYFLVTAAALVTLALLMAGWDAPDLLPWLALPLLFSGAFLFLGVHDLLQTRHAILRNYPIAAHLRFLLENIRPEMRQYFFEAEKDGTPFPRDKRAIVYQRAKRELETRPFGTQYDVYADSYEWLHHSLSPVHLDPAMLRVMIGGPACALPYLASVFNISAMSYGSLSASAVRSLNRGAKLGGFAHDTGEGGFTPYHEEHGGDIIWELGSGYFGARDANGRFAPDKFAALAQKPQIKMVELKLSQGAKPGHGGVLPAAKVTAEIARIRGVPEGQDCISPAKHSSFDTPVELLQLIDTMRRLSGGKPAGFKLCIGHKWEFLAIVKAMLETGITPDFIVVDGKEGGTGAAPLEFMDHLGMPMRDGLSFVHNALIGAGLREKIKIGAAGKIISGFDIARAMALGADWCNSARGFMFAVGCIQAQQCHTGHCPTGVTSPDPWRSRAIVVTDKSQRVAAFHEQTIKALAELIGAAGLKSPSEIRPSHFMRRIGPDRIVSLADLHPSLAPGELLAGTDNPQFQHAWSIARADTFAPAP